ncbi:hypothetical protein ACQCSX_22480 (plasmid) [Pseudarthrobacter sp. P1]|uniref:hypothetical protein n=1 Tax=Pseudarthrobacter sp. P1 TaxID=3418418 RepID=UPI003CE67072
METPDPRIDAIIAHTPYLQLLGDETIQMVLTAAEATGLIPESRREVRYGIDRRPHGGDVAETYTRESAVDMIAAGSGGPASIRGPIVTRTVTTYRTRYTDWVPATESEESHV